MVASSFKNSICMTILSEGFNENILICGGAGFIGSHLTKKFIDDGDSVTVFDNNVPILFYPATKYTLQNMDDPVWEAIS